VEFVKSEPHDTARLVGKTVAVQAPGKTFTNSIGMEFVLIPAGEFMMGSDKEKDPNADKNETPRHRVSISEPFYLGKYAVIQAQWEVVMGNIPSSDFYYSNYSTDGKLSLWMMGMKRINSVWSKGQRNRNNPVVSVSWDDAQEFIKRLNAKEGHKRYRLSTEAEWEYAARAGSTSAYSFGDDAGQLGRYAWYDGDWQLGSTHPVGQKEANAWGLYDMHGNVWEWVQDWYGEEYYRTSSESCHTIRGDNWIINSLSIDPRGPLSGSYRVFRGGSWISPAGICRSAFRDYSSPGFGGGLLGFRLALSPV
jgi:formylglycine-generating enzyme required for sulfatase activity